MATRKAETDEAPPEEPTAAATAEAPKPNLYRVLKAFTVDDTGQTIMPGEIVEASADWPHRRPKQLVDLGYLLALKGDDDAH